MSEGSSMEVDPRVKWAIDAFDDEGHEQTTLAAYYGYPFAAAAFASSLTLSANFMARRPLYVNLPVTLALAAGGFVGGVWLRGWSGRKNAQDVAVIKHYIMTHPELFPEPEKKKFADKEVFFSWRMAR